MVIHWEAGPTNQETISTTATATAMTVASFMLGVTLIFGITNHLAFWMPLVQLIRTDIKPLFGDPRFYTMVIIDSS